jgi:hypothetical protein
LTKQRTHNKLPDTCVQAKQLYRWVNLCDLKTIIVKSKSGNSTVNSGISVLPITYLRPGRSACALILGPCPPTKGAGPSHVWCSRGWITGIPFSFFFLQLPSVLPVLPFSLRKLLVFPLCAGRECHVLIHDKCSNCILCTQRLYQLDRTCQVSDTLSWIT